MNSWSCMAWYGRIVKGVCLAALGGFMLQGCSDDEECLFGKVPLIYERHQLKYVKELKDEIAKGRRNRNVEPAEAFAVLAGLKVVMGEARAEAEPLAGEMVGKTVSYVEGDSLPYRIVSDMKVREMLFPEMSFAGNRPIRLRLEFDVVLERNQEQPLVMYYWLTDGKQPLGGHSIKLPESGKKGDTLHLAPVICAPDIPAQYVMECKMIYFVSRSVYDNGKKTLAEKQKEWNEELAVKLEKYNE